MANPLSPPTAKALFFPKIGRRTWLMLELPDGRAAGVPLSLFPTLQRASTLERSRHRVIGGGVGFHWPGLDYDLSVEGILEGRGEAMPRLKRRSA